MRQSILYNKICESVTNGEVNSKFRVADFDFLKKSKSFLSKHAVGNGKYREYFIRISRGLYKLK